MVLETTKLASASLLLIACGGDSKSSDSDTVSESDKLILN
jgi:hypothetical protein